ncbi:MAG TPA: zinc-binding dehydrogenase, partial [Actinomycetes bacterium]|nr:zinc-binding dehydrogenase [Actinomycetes bacterium]
VPKGAYMPIAEGIDPAIATVLGTAITGMSIKTAAGFVPGETVLVQGATGVAGRLAVKVARLLGARRIIATGRDNDQLREVQTLGADTVINTAVPDEALAQAYLDAKGDGYDVVLDYLWGRPTEILLRSVVPKSFAFPKPTRLIQVGESAGAALTLAAESLRTSGVEIYGAAKGLSSQTMHEVYSQVVAWAQTGELTFDVVKVPLSDIETAWQRTDLRGSRLVVVP